VFLVEAMQEHSRRIGATPPKRRAVENQRRVEVYRGIQPRPLAVDFDGVSSTVTAKPSAGTLSASRRTQFQTAP
jgi:hypothetical protein